MPPVTSQKEKFHKAVFFLWSGVRLKATDAYYYSKTLVNRIMRTMGPGFFFLSLPHRNYSALQTSDSVDVKVPWQAHKTGPKVFFSSASTCLSYFFPTLTCFFFPFFFFILLRAVSSVASAAAALLQTRVLHQRLVQPVAPPWSGVSFPTPLLRYDVNKNKNRPLQWALCLPTRHSG